MSVFLQRLIRSPIRRRTALFESLGYLALVIVWLIFWPNESTERIMLGNMLVAAPAASAALQILFSLRSFPDSTRKAWFYLALALSSWSFRHLFWVFYGLILQSEPPLVSLVDLFGLLAYPLAAYGLIQFSAGFRNAPLRFRFLLDMAVNSGVVVAFGWLFLSRTLSLAAIQYLPVIYPIADLVLLMVVVNLSMARRMPASLAVVLSIALLGLTFSDYAYSYLSLYQSYRSGFATSLGWIVGFLLLGNEAISERRRGHERQPKYEADAFDVTTQFQNVLPVTLVLALCWYVLADWRLSGQLSWSGFSMSILFIVILVVRLGIRAGEVELQQYWQLFSSLAEPAFISDAKGKILLSNPALTRLLTEDLPAAIFPARLESTFDLERSEDELLAQAAREAVTSNVSLKKNNAPYLLTLSPISAEGRRTMIAGVAHDLTVQVAQQNEIRKAYEELQIVYRQLGEMNAQLETRVEERTHTLQEAYDQLEQQHRALQELDGLKTDFISMVSHELRTPLNNLGGGVELLLNKPGALPLSQNTLMLMQAEIRRLTRFVENILNLSAVDAGRLELRPLPVSLAVIMDEVVRKRFKGPGEERIDNRVSPDLPLVLADESALQSVLHHLIDNAIKYADEGPVIIDAFPHEQSVHVQVTDRGPGIPAEKRHLLFQKFQRLNVSDSQSVYGYGLGLYLSRRLLQAMNSDLEFKAPSEGGACFYFCLKAVES